MTARTNWWQLFNGGGRVAEAKELIHDRLVPLEAMVALLFGECTGIGAAEQLKQGATALAKGEKISCGDCNQEIFTQGHNSNCHVIFKAQRVLEALKKRREAIG